MKSFVLLLLSTLAVFGQVPSFKSFNPAQFNTNNFIVSIKDGATLTNITIRNSLTLPSLPDSTITLNGVTITNWTDIGPVETNSLWIEIAGVLQPLVGNQVLVTNLSSQNVLSALGAFTMPASYSTNLVAGTNCLNPYNLGSVWITGADATAAGSTISLVSGNGQGQLLILQNYSVGSGFTMFNGIPFCDGSGGFVRLNGDWATTNRGDTLFLYNTGQIWTEVGRAYASTNIINGDNVWVNESGHIHPVDGNANNVLTFTSGLADNATNVAMVVGTTNYWSASGSLLAAFGNAGTNRNWIHHNGSVNIGQDSANQWGGGDGLVSFFNTSLGDTFANEITAGVTDGAGIYNYINIQAHTNSAAVGMEFSTGSVVTKFRPGVVSSGSAVAYLFDTSSTLTNGDKLVSIGNAGVEQANISPIGGGILVGPNANSYWGGNAEAATLVGAKVTGLGDGEINQILVATSLATSGIDQGQVFSLTQTNRAENSVFVYQANNPYSLQSVVDLSGGGTDAYIKYDANGTNIMYLHPTVTSSGSAVGYQFDTANTLSTAGAVIASFRNSGTNYLDIDKTGVLLFGPGTTNTLFRSGSDLVYDNDNTAGFGIQLQGPTGTGSIQNSDGAGTMKIQANTSRAIFLSPDNGSVDYVALAASFKPDVLGKDLGDSSSNGRWNNFHLDGKITWNGTTNSVFDLAGSGSPEGVVTASPGSTYRNFSGGSLTTFWVKESGTGNTGWIGK